MSQFLYLDPKTGADGKALDGSGLVITGDASRMNYGYGLNFPDGVDSYTAVYDKASANCGGA